MFEVEQKFRVKSVDALIERLTNLGAKAAEIQTHADTYFNHPARDFSQSREALRIRRVDGIPMITYKGKKLPGEIKARREMEWRLDPGDEDGSKTEWLLTTLGFRLVKTVHKTRRPFGLPEPWSDLEVVVDQVDQLGTFAEVEAVLPDQTGVEQARERIAKLATTLNLDQAESRSYLRMLIEQG